MGALVSMSSASSPVAMRPQPHESPPLVVDLDGTLLLGDSLHECFVASFMRHPVRTARAVASSVTRGRAGLKRALWEAGALEPDQLPLRADLVAWLEQQKRAGRELHLATAADENIARGVAKAVGLFDGVFASDGLTNLKGPAKAKALKAAFPEGFSYAGDCAADLAVWREAESAVVVGSPGLARRAERLTRVELILPHSAGGAGAWLKAARPHQWAKNLLIFAPVILGWPQVTPAGLLQVILALVLLCALSSLTYIVNDLADVQADRRHATKRRRPFAAGELPLSHGMAAAFLGIPLVLAVAAATGSVAMVSVLAGYGALTLAYSGGLKRAPLLDCFVIASLFTLRIALGVAAANLAWSPWLLAFSIFLFFSLSLAKRHTELVAAGPLARGPVPGRGYRYEDHTLTLVFGIAAATVSMLVIVLYLMDEVFPRGVYRHPLWLWLEPPLMFLWVGRIWLLANRGEMHDDPVIFALRDRVSYAVFAAMGAAFLLAVF